LLVLGTVLSLLLAACAPAATPAPTQPAAPEPTATLAPTKTAVPEPTATLTPTAEPGKLILATTTSTADSGLLDFILPDFEKEFNVKVEVIAVGSGQALQTGKDGNADVLLVHSPAAEKAFMDAGDGTRREDVMYNDYVIVGPESDPAKISGMTTAADAFKAIAAAKAPFVSRGDDSGTNAKEKTIWKAAGIEPAGDWYISAGQGMGAVLTMSDEKQAYTLSDRATYLSMTKKDLKLKVLVEGEKALFNPYGVITVNPAKSPKINADMATKFVDWIISLPVQEKISTFGQADYGQTLFNPSSKIWKEAHP
jgi:tungstate transport system substrate-binding protein